MLGRTLLRATVPPVANTSEMVVLFSAAILLAPFTQFWLLKVKFRLVGIRLVSSVAVVMASFHIPMVLAYIPATMLAKKTPKSMLVPTSCIHLAVIQQLLGVGFSV